jgi:8-oxo-dGTP pyrophosphatase MutT (NUDIX family)
MKKAAIGILFRNQKKEILILKRRDIPIWVLPGGGIEQEETPENAVIREVWEETGLHVEVKQLLATYSPINRLTALTFVFECEVVSGNLTWGAETEELLFAPIDHLPKFFFFLHHAWVQDALSNYPKPLHKTLNQITYFKAFLYFVRHPLWVMRYFFTRFCSYEECETSNKKEANRKKK